MTRLHLRTRVAVAAAGAVVLAIVLVSVGSFLATRRQLADDLDEGLLRAAHLVAELDPVQRERLVDAVEAGGSRRGPGGGRELLDLLGPGGDRVERLLGPLGTGAVQLVDRDGTGRSLVGPDLPVDATTVRLAQAGAGDAHVRDATLLGDPPLRVVTVPLDGGGAVQVAARPAGTDPALAALRRQLTVLGLLGAVLAGGLGLLAADRAVRPVRRLTDAAEDVGRTQALETRIEVEGDDELARLAAAFNGMLASLEGARAAQQELVADASHELRTPLTSLRTNVEVLARADELAPEERRDLLRDVALQLEEFGRLVDGLVELARGDGPARAPTPVVLRELVDDVVDRASVFAPQVAVDVVADDSVVVAERDRLERAVANLVDNAVKHGGGRVEVRVADGAVVVRDHGPGFADGEVDRVFDRFYRAPSARARPGSGLGLSIVAQVAEAHGGTHEARNHPDGGAEVVLRLPSA